MTKLELVKELVKENINSAKCGIFFTRNIVGDPMTTIYNDGKIIIKICYNYSYFEIFGLTKDEQEEIYNYYQEVRSNV